MKTILSWRKGFFTSNYEIFSDGKPLGLLKEQSFHQKAEGNLNGRIVAFKTSGFFKQETEITDTVLQKVIGKITFNSWKTKAEIELEGKKLVWKYDNAWNSKWSISDSTGTLARFISTSKGGDIEAVTFDEMMILTGLFITNYFRQTTVFVVLIALFVVIIS